MPPGPSSSPARPLVTGDRWIAISPACLVNTTSAAGLLGNVGQTNYAAAKAAISAMTLVTAQELGRHGVQANAVAPLARTRLTEGSPGIDTTVPPDGFDRWAPENVAPLVAHLVSARCRLNGAVLHVVGGEIGIFRGWDLEVLARQDTPWDLEVVERALSQVPGEASVPMSNTLELAQLLPEVQG
jgi:NAD(P)-dependent dehydrogenase (short-subunit alcohol dehydrogenase family)